MLLCIPLDDRLQIMMDDGCLSGLLHILDFMLYLQIYVFLCVWGFASHCAERVHIHAEAIATLIPPTAAGNNRWCLCWLFKRIHAFRRAKVGTFQRDHPLVIRVREPCHRKNPQMNPIVGTCCCVFRLMIAFKLWWLMVVYQSCCIFLILLRPTCSREIPSEKSACMFASVLSWCCTSNSFGFPVASQASRSFVLMVLLVFFCAVGFFKHHESFKRPTMCPQMSEPEREVVRFDMLSLAQGTRSQFM